MITERYISVSWIIVTITEVIAYCLYLVRAVNKSVNNIPEIIGTEILSFIFSLVVNSIVAAITDIIKFTTMT